MDAHVFRHISSRLGSLLQGGRVEGIHEPVSGVTAFSLFASGKKLCLILRAHRSAPLLFLTAKNPLPNPPFPPDSVMRLRKYCEGRRLGTWVADWVNRRMAFAVPGPKDESPGWLLLDCKHGPAYLPKLPENFTTQVKWPPLPLACPLSIVDDASWHEFPVLTPSLRRTLSCLDTNEAAALLNDLEYSQGDLFWYMDEGIPCLLCAWPLPPRDEEEGDSLSLRITTPQSEDTFTLLEAMYMPALLKAAQATQASPTLKQDRAAAKRDKRRHAKRMAEKERLLKLVSLETDARLIQASLWRFAPGTRLESVTLPLLSETAGGETKSIALNPLLTLTENMQAMFHQAHRAERGLAMLESRLRLAAETHSQAAPRPKETPASANTKNIAARNAPPPSLVQTLFSSDGLPLWRGKNAKGNTLIVKLARPFDLWFHVEDGPGAHLLIRREHAEQTIPETTLREAAILAALKSWRKDDPKAPVMAALSKHVRPIKGAAAGTVSVQEVWRSFMVPLDRQLEEKLAGKDVPSSVPHI